MEYAHFDIHCEFPQPTRLPRFKGSMIRGAMGHALKETVCAVREKICDRCLLRQTCLYARVFEVKPVNGPPIGVVNLPHPYVLDFEGDHATKTEFAEGEAFQFRLLLFGSLIDMLPYFVYTFDKMGQSGLGKNARGNRQPYRLKEVRHDNQVLYHSEEPTLPPTIPRKNLEWHQPTPAQDLLRVQVHLLTPLRVKDQNRFVEHLEFIILIRTILRRLKALWSEFDKACPEIPEKQLLQLAETITVESSTLRWEDQTRYSSRQQTMQKMGGLQGTIIFTGELTPFLPLLAMAQVTHIGKETSFGLGKIHYDVM
ncbi:CRISPR system precrRNA processing endoribonuclease RAMP protein Cas6 [Deltaproteobacteria bacterium TL4]